MKRLFFLMILLALLFIAVGCSGAENTLPEETPPVPLSVSDLNDVLDTLDVGDASLTCRGKTKSTYPAGAAIRAESYVEKLRSFTWEEYTPPAEWNEEDDFFCRITTPDVTITSLQNGDNDSRPLHLVTEEGEGWFVLPYIQSEADKAAGQASWMAYDTFFSWWQEAESAILCRAGGTALTAEELEWFEEYTASVRMEYDGEGGGYVAGAAEISCFFTSHYSDPRDMDANAFLAYCPDRGVLTEEDEEEWQLVQKEADWRSGEDNHLAGIGELPVPCHRFPRTYVDEILTKYAGITVEEMHSDWTAEALYVAETDCFYTFSSDFGPGTFIPCYGEKVGDTVMLWAVPDAYNGSVSVLALQKNGESWRILSHLAAADEQ